MYCHLKNIKSYNSQTSENFSQPHTHLDAVVLETPLGELGDLAEAVQALHAAASHVLLAQHRLVLLRQHQHVPAHLGGYDGYLHVCLLKVWFDAFEMK